MLQDNLYCGYCSAPLGTINDIRCKEHDCLKDFNDIGIEEDSGKVFGFPQHNPALFSEKQESNWTNEGVKLLINAYKNNKHKFYSPQYSNRQVWNIISDELKSESFIKSGHKCDEKWRNLKATYKKTLDHNKATGNNRVTWEFFDDFHEIYFKCPDINPVATASSSGAQTKVTDNSQNLSEPTSEENVASPKQKKRKVENEKVEFLRELDQNKERRHHEKIEQRERMFQWFVNKFDK